jgi:signal transduction histidine kinase
VKVASGPLRQILSNLLVNAIDATPAAGSLAVRAHLRTANKSATAYLVTTVADNGQGIAPELREKVFEPFFTTKETVGTGLGLWVSRELAQQLGGSLRVRSRVGRGTVFTVSVPISAAAMAVAE